MPANGRWDVIRHLKVNAANEENFQYAVIKCCFGVYYFGPKFLILCG